MAGFQKSYPLKYLLNYYHQFQIYNFKLSFMITIMSYITDTYNCQLYNATNRKVLIVTCVPSQQGFSC